MHYRTPRMYVWRIIRGMLPYKTKRGKAALGRLKLFEGIPPPFDKKRKVCILRSMRTFRLGVKRAYTSVADICGLVGWKHQRLLREQENLRKKNAIAYREAKKEMNKLRYIATKQTNKIVPKLSYDIKIKYGKLRY
eukprot:NODE_1636_length_1107_cov_95.731569_g1336_i0.p1 GENE.NODE_1636_length_1107_cov_95.731569_g1336_i0~~NODE_1636_length_1107_cov_95.731569_g1336_i0.p1  ORF type:complete len:136 (-),score=22.07 NODE_1636_length_1107_cov_95.731569_g1336_i0:359-766(-)